jgi:regulator of cell morphogenesis and NO signaling
MQISGDTRIGDIATLVPVSIEVFERYGVDFYRNGDRPLEEALKEAGLSVGDILAEIERALEARREEDLLHAEWAENAPGTLADHIREAHHDYLRTQLPRVAEELVTTLLSWGDEHDALYGIAREFQHLRRGLESQLEEEERHVFPQLLRLSETVGRELAADDISAGGDSLAAMLDRLQREHGETLESLRVMRSLASDYRVAEDSCLECAGLYQELGAMEVDIERHIHLEDDVLIPAMRRLAGL